jgi:small neutral amino acid transporter SnatA (MarC family)
VDFSVVVLLPVAGSLLVWVEVDDSEDFVSAAGAPGEPVSPVAPVAPVAPAGPCTAGPGVSIVVLHPAAPKLPTKIAIAAIAVYAAALFIIFFIASRYQG